MLGRPVQHHSPARVGKSRRVVERMMREVHEDTPSTVKRAHVSGAGKERMLRAIGLSKARKAGATVKGY